MPERPAPDPLYVAARRALLDGLEALGQQRQAAILVGAHAVYLRVGEPFRLPPVDRKDREASLQRNTDEIMCRIAAMIPPEYWGVYANHPRLKELLKESPG